MVLLPVNNVSADMAKPIDVMVLKEKSSDTSHHERNYPQNYGKFS